MPRAVSSLRPPHRGCRSPRSISTNARKEAPAPGRACGPTPASRQRRYRKLDWAWHFDARRGHRPPLGTLAGVPLARLVCVGERRARAAGRPGAGRPCRVPSAAGLALRPRGCRGLVLLSWDGLASLRRPELPRHRAALFLQLVFVAVCAAIRRSGPARSHATAAAVWAPRGAGHGRILPVQHPTGPGAVRRSNRGLSALRGRLRSTAGHAGRARAPVPPGHTGGELDGARELLLRRRDPADADFLLALADASHLRVRDERVVLERRANAVRGERRRGVGDSSRDPGGTLRVSPNRSRRSHEIEPVLRPQRLRHAARLLDAERRAPARSRPAPRTARPDARPAALRGPPDRPRSLSRPHGPRRPRRHRRPDDRVRLPAGRDAAVGRVRHDGSEGGHRYRCRPGAARRAQARVGPSIGAGTALEEDGDLSSAHMLRSSWPSQWPRRSSPLHGS